MLVSPITKFSDLTHPDEFPLVVKVSQTTLALDLTTMARLYAWSGIVDYWVLDVGSRRLIVHRDPTDGLAFSEDERVTTLAAPERNVRVGGLF